jgi:hypothetical protein
MGLTAAPGFARSSVNLTGWAFSEGNSANSKHNQQTGCKTDFAQKFLFICVWFKKILNECCYIIGKSTAPAYMQN